MPILALRKAPAGKGEVRFQPSTVRGLRAASYKPKSFKNGTFEGVMASETPCRTWRITEDWNYVEVDEILPMKSLRDVRSLKGRPILDSHNDRSVRNVIGVIEDAWIDGDKLMFRGRLSDRADNAGVARDIENGILNSFSVGFDILKDGRIEKRDGQRPLVRVRDWKAFEVSVVPIPADDTAKIRSRSRAHAGNPSSRNGTTFMPMDSNTFRKRASKAFDSFVDELVEMLSDEADEDEDEDGAAGAGSRGRGDEPKLSEAAKAAKVRKLRAACKKRGLLEEFEALEESGAGVEKLQDLMLSSVRTSGVSIDGGKGLEDGTDAPKGKLRSRHESKKLGLTK